MADDPAARLGDEGLRRERGGGQAQRVGEHGDVFVREGRADQSAYGGVVGGGLRAQDEVVRRGVVLRGVMGRGVMGKVGLGHGRSLGGGVGSAPRLFAPRPLRPER